MDSSKEAKRADCLMPSGREIKPYEVYAEIVSARKRLANTRGVKPAEIRRDLALIELWESQQALPGQESLAVALNEVKAERQAQESKRGQQNHPDGTSGIYTEAASAHKEFCDLAFKEGYGTWADILKEEFFEALAETDPAALRTELIQVAAVAVAWVECIDRRQGTQKK